MLKDALAELAENNPTLERFEAMLVDMWEICEAKRSDYAGHEAPHANLTACARLGMEPWIGALVRMQDKMCRLERFAKTGTLEVTDETVIDTLMDLAVYALLARELYEDHAPVRADAPPPEPAP